MTTTSSHLLSDKVNLLELKEWLRREFLSFFEDCSGKKSIIWDNQLTQPLGLIADYKVLKERGVERMMDLRQIKPLRNKDVQDVQHVFFIVKPKLELMSLIAQNILSLESEMEGGSKEFHIIFVPRKSHLCEKKLKELGVYGSFKENLKEYFLDLIPLDCDLLSMENPEIFPDSFLYNDCTYLFHIAKSIMTFQTLYGIIPNVYGKGKCAKMVAEQIFRMRQELGPNEEPQMAPKVDNLIILDRSVDFLTPLMTQLTYEGLIDENFGIKYTQLEIPQDRLKKSTAEGVNVVEMKKSIVILNSADGLYSAIRDKNFHGINIELSKTAKELQNTNNQKNELNSKSVSEIRTFVEKTLKNYQAKKLSLENHMTIAEIIKEITIQDEFFEKLQCQNDLLTGQSGDKPNSHILNAIGRGEDIYMILRLICIHCIVNSGFKPQLLETYKREIIRAYGFKYFDLVHNLEKSGLIYTQQQKTFNTIGQKLNLFVENINEENPNDIAYVFSGYAPLSVRFCQYLTGPNAKSYGDVFGLLPGAFLEEAQRITGGIRKRRNSASSINSSQSSHNSDKKMTLVFFIGGCTFAEISAFRHLSNEAPESSSEFIVATTCIINGKSLITQLQDLA